MLLIARITGVAEGINGLESERIKAKQVRCSRQHTHIKTHTDAQAFLVLLYGLGGQPGRHTEKRIGFQLPYLK